MSNTLNMLTGKIHTCPQWLCFTFDNPLRKLMQNPIKVLSPFIREGYTILDLGPGTGYFTLSLCKMTGEKGKVYAADIQKEMLEAIKQKAKKQNINNLELFLIRNAGLDMNCSFDFILAFWMFHEVGDKENVMAQLYNKLKENGTLLLVEPIIHVGGKRFESEVELAKKSGFVIADYPKIALSRTVLLKKPNPKKLS